jgi:hypothetical protein
MSDLQTGNSPPPRIDARNDKQRTVAKHLREQHLPGVDTDDDASITLEIEQARLALFASGAVLAFEVTQLLSSARSVCFGPLYWSLALLCFSMCGAWLALILSEQIRRFRVDRRYRIYHGELAEYLTLKDDSVIEPYPQDAEWSGQIRQETQKRSDLRVLRYFVIAFVAAGIGTGILAAIGTADPRRCHSEMLKPRSASTRSN